MVKRRSIKAQERNLRLSEAVLGVQTGKYKSSNAAAIALGLWPDTVRKREIVLLKWIKELTASGYAPSHRILREVADEVRSNKCRVFQPQHLQLQQQPQTQQPQTQQPQIPNLPL
ncbi:hypothetical protein V499_08932, partial [Pseudogymnoascus sp. VKM F-103]